MELLVKKITGTLQPEEEQELLLHMKEDPAARKLADQFSPEFLASELALKEEIDTAAAWKKFRSQAGFRSGLIRWNSRSMAVAASLLVIISTGLYLVFHHNDQRNTTVLNEKPRKDITRPEGKPVLTLADGNSVVLDSKISGNETLKQQGITNVNDSVLLYGKNATGAVSWNTVSTPKGVSYKLVLPDGTGVWLNTASSVRFPTAFVDAAREVTVTGETYFEVAKNKVPFRVNAGNATIEVLGTHFNIEAWPEKTNVNTTLLEGAVMVETAKEKMKLKPGEQAVVNTSITLNKNIDIDQVLAWKQNEFVFRANTIQNIMENLARYYDFEVEYRGAITSSLFVGSFSRNAPLSDILSFLEKTGSIHFRIDGRKVIVMP